MSDDLRFIPTRVGQITSVRIRQWASAVHPHACGADRMRNMAFTMLIGSSPRVWGR